jgi:hypothetical protein
MSDKKTQHDGVTVRSSLATPSPTYSYQTYQGKSGSASTKAPRVEERRFVELQNLVLTA